MKQSCFIGIDVGTQGVRVVMIDQLGNNLFSAEKAFPLSDRSREEQSPEQWWNACNGLLQQLSDNVKRANIIAISVTSTSGTVIPLDENNQPLHHAIMYSDKRSAKVAEECKALAECYSSSSYTAFNYSSALPKMVWFVREFPEKAALIKRWVHATDYIIGKLCGHFEISDYTNVLKTGYDVNQHVWPSYIYEKLPIRREWLQKVVPSGTVIGNILPAIAQRYKFQPDIQIVSGMTDSCASQVASGAVALGDWNTTIGTTMVIKGVTEYEIKDPLGRLYSHRHPEGYWMPGGASNTGADWVSGAFSDAIEGLTKEAKSLIPGNFFSYPLQQTGERFPFIAPQAIGFEQQGLTLSERFVANMEGLAYIERYAYELIEKLSGERVRGVFTAGGGSNNEVWLKIRSNVLNLPIRKVRNSNGATGAAIIAASKTYFTSLSQAARTLTQIEKEVLPEKGLAEKYNKNYNAFIALLIEKAYIKNE